MIFTHAETLFIRRLVSGTASRHYDHAQRARLRESCCVKVLSAVEDVDAFCRLVHGRSLAPSIYATCRTAQRGLAQHRPILERIKTHPTGVLEPAEHAPAHGSKGKSKRSKTTGEE
jgi:hypothetical protein